jgi:hypothetical protein
MFSAHADEIRRTSGQDSNAVGDRSIGAPSRPGYATSRIYRAGSVMPRATASPLRLNGTACVASRHQGHDLVV